MNFDVAKYASYMDLLSVYFFAVKITSV